MSFCNNLFVDQEAVSDGGPLLAILGFLILPIVWSVPEAMVTAELATAFPENSGYVAWVTAAFGPFWGFQVRVVFGPLFMKGLGCEYCDTKPCLKPCPSCWVDSTLL